MAACLLNVRPALRLENVSVVHGKNVAAGLTSFVLGIALVSLITGSVGIVTSLYTVVTERTREISTMKAIGMNEGAIMALFLVEVLMVGIIGAMCGLLAGIFGGYLITTRHSA